MIPLEKIVNYQGNKYELGVAIINLANEMKINDVKELEETSGKAAPIALFKILNNEVKWSKMTEQDEEDELKAKQELNEAPHDIF